MENYVEVEIASYVKQGIEDGTMVPIQAEKFARIIARQGVVGETIVSWSADSQGNEIQEKVAQVQVDPQTNQPGWIATKVDEDGNIIIDNNGHPNQWIIDDTTFNKKYEIDPQNPSLCKPKGGAQIFVKITDNIIVNQWGGSMKVAEGGYINITNPDDMYAISERDFIDTYKEIVNPTKKSSK